MHVRGVLIENAIHIFKKSMMRADLSQQEYMDILLMGCALTNSSKGLCDL